jgi:hypothetical protein
MKAEDRKERKVKARIFNHGLTRINADLPSLDVEC